MRKLLVTAVLALNLVAGVVYANLIQFKPTGGGGGSTFAFIASTSAASSDTNNVTTTGIDTTGAKLIVIATSSYGSYCTAVSDNKGNSYTALTGRTDTVSKYAQLFYVISPTVGSAHTFTCTGTGDYPAIAVLVAGDTGTPSFDAENGNTSGTGTIQPGSVTPTVNNSLVVTGLWNFTLGAASIDSGFTKAEDLEYVGGTNMGIALGYVIETTATAQNPTWTHSGELAATIASFKP